MDSVKSIRHFMEPSDNIKKYEWEIHNGCDFGILNLEDSEMNISFQMTFTNILEDNKGNHWVVRISGNETNIDERGIVLLWYITNPNKSIKNLTHYGINYNGKAVKGTYIDNFIPIEFSVLSKQDQSNKHPIFNKTEYINEYFIVLDISGDKLYDPTEYIIGELKDNVGYLPNHLIDPNDSYRSSSLINGNVYVQQLFLIKNFSLDIHFFESEIEVDKLEKEYITKIFNQKKDEFERKFNEIFSFTNQNDFLGSEFYYDDQKLTAKSALCSLFSNLIYMNGQLQILDLDSKSNRLSNLTELLTIGPDKTSHSRGFMWDEGFQQRILLLWNKNMSLRIINNWFRNIDGNGWLPREQSLDDESRSRAPPSSWASIPNVANPPSLYSFIEDLFQNDINQDILMKFLKEIIDKLEKNAYWFITSQKSNYSYVYSWKGKTDDFCLPSGLDDYPRSRLNGQLMVEGHVDLQSWILVICRTMVKIYKYLGTEYQEKYLFWNDYHNNVKDSLINEFWDKHNKRFDDFYINESGKKVFSGHLGYLQLFPLILNVFEENLLKNETVYINDTLNLILDYSNGLRTDYGVRSLSINDTYYMKGQNYWTSPIWININYLILRTLYKLKNDQAYFYLNNEYKDIRNSVINNMVKNFKENGFIWEVYNDMDGHGMYNHPFTGWSALIVNIIYELY